MKYIYAACVLTENGFMDSETSLTYLESNEGKKSIIALHVDGIIDFCEKRKNEPLLSRLSTLAHPTRPETITPSLGLLYLSDDSLFRQHIVNLRWTKHNIAYS